MWPRVVLLGDSITQYSFELGGWGSIVQNLLFRKCDVFNRGFSGYNTKMILHCAEEIITKELFQGIAAVTLFLGANDAALPEEKPTQHVPVRSYQENLLLIIEKIKKIGIKGNQIIVITPPPISETCLLEDMVLKGEGTKCTRTNKNAEIYSRACLKVAEESDCRYIDLWKSINFEDDMKSFLCDGLHLSVKGNKRVADLLTPHLNELTSTLPMLLPYWRDFTYNN